MASSQEGRHASYHALTTSQDPSPYNEAAMLAAEDQASATGTYNERQLALINNLLAASYDSLPAAQAAMAAVKNATNWSALSDVS